MSQISPTLLQTQLSIPVGGATGVADSTKLENPFQGPMWLDEIRFRFPRQSGPITAAPWPSFRINLKLNNIPLTNGYVPLGLLGKTLNDSVQSATANLGAFIFTWRLPKPLFIPAREYLRASAYYQPFTTTTAPTPKVMTLIYCCRPLSINTPTPNRIQLPWVSYFQPPNIDFTASGLGVNRVDQSQPSDLYNPWDQDLYVQRFVGRFMQQLNGVGQELQGPASLWNERVDLQTGAIETATLVTAQDSFNNILVRDPTPFGHLFNFNDRAWTVNALLPPKGFYLFDVDRQWAAYRSELAQGASVGISMVGWREVQYA